MRAVRRRTHWPRRPELVSLHGFLRTPTAASGWAPTACPYRLYRTVTRVDRCHRSIGAPRCLPSARTWFPSTRDRSPGARRMSRAKRLQSVPMAHVAQADDHVHAVPLLAVASVVILATLTNGRPTASGAVAVSEVGGSRTTSFSGGPVMIGSGPPANPRSRRRPPRGRTGCRGIPHAASRWRPPGQHNLIDPVTALGQPAQASTPFDATNAQR